MCKNSTETGIKKDDPGSKGDIMMTYKELSQLSHLNREIKQMESRLAELESKGTLRSGGLTGVPSGSSATDKVSRYAAEIVDLKAAIAEKELECIQERNRLTRYINTIPDSLTRQVFMLRFADGLSWGQTAAKIGGGNTKDSIKKRVFRYLDKNVKK